MAARRGRYTRLLVGGNAWAYDFSSQSNKLQVKMAAARLDSTTFQASGKTSIADDPSGGISQSGYFERSAVAAENMEEHLHGAIANSTALYVAALLATDIAACPAWVARNTTAAGMTLDTGIGALMTLQGEWPQGEGMARGVRVWQGTITATGAQAAPAYLDLGAAGAAGGFAWLWVTNITGTATGATINLQMDDNSGFATPTTKGTFTFSSASGRAQELVLAGSIERYLRLNTTSKGGATDFDVVAIVGVAGLHN